MFDFLTQIEITDALAGLHYAIRRITHRHTSVNEEDVSLPLNEFVETQESVAGLEIGLKIVQEIEILEKNKLGYLSKAKANKYKKKLSKIAKDITKKNLNYDSRKGKQLLEEWRQNPLENISNSLNYKEKGIFSVVEQTNTIENVLRKALRHKFQHHAPEPAYMPFHTRLLGKDRLALYSFIHSLNTNFGTTIFEPVALALAKSKFKDAKAQIKAGEYISEEAQKVIQNIMDNLTTAVGIPNKLEEIERIREVCQKGEMKKVKPTKVDVFTQSFEDELFLFDIKTAKPNAGGFKEFKRTLLEWVAVVLAETPDMKVNTLIAIPYNPYFPEPYNRWTMRGMLDLKEELKVAEEFWDFLGGEGAYQNLLDIFEKVGIELRTEIDDYFSRFNR